MAETLGGSQQIQRHLESFSVVELFGRYTYSIPERGRSIEPRLAILYGDNGTGKTTILKALHHLVSPSTSRGHRTALSKIPFARFEASFTGGLRIAAIREVPSDGSYTLVLYQGFLELGRAEYIVSDGRISRESPGNAEREAFSAMFSGQLGLLSYFLDDNRVLESDAFEQIEFEESEPWRMDARQLQYTLDRGNQRERQLTLALERARDWATHQALAGANLGSVGANSVYSTVVEQLMSSPSGDDMTARADAPQTMLSTLGELSARAERQSSFGLTTPIDVKSFVTALNSPTDQRDLVVRVLQPYVEGITARLDALEDLYRVLNNFTERLNSFFRDKSVTFNARDGLRVRTMGNLPLPHNKLSSGEGQLLMLMCNLLFARQGPCLFIIDEPELSLNVKWQRQLLTGLLECAEGSGTQLIIATHSIELLTGHSDSVLELGR